VRCLLIAITAIAMFCATSLAASPIVAKLQPDLEAATELARSLARKGDIDASREQWQQVLAAHERSRSEAGLEQALDALAELDFLQGRYQDYRLGQEQRLQRSEANGDRAAMATALMRLAMLERRVGELDASQLRFEQVLAIHRELGDRDQEALMLTHLGMVLIHKGDFTDALEVLSASLDLQNSGAQAELDRTWHYFGLLYRALQDYEQSQDYLKRGLEVARSLPNPMRQAPLLGSLARVSNDAGRHEEALGYSEASNTLSRRFGSLPGQAFDAMERGRALLGLGRLTEARDVLEDCIRLASSIGQRGTEADARFTLARLALLEQRVDDALALLDTALPTYIDAADLLQTLETHQLLIPLLRQRGEFERALAMSEESLRLQNRISNLQTNRRMALLEHSQRSQEAERQIELLRRDNEIQSLRLRQAQLTWQIGAIAVAGLLLVALTLLLRYRTVRRLARSLSASNAELGASRAALSEAHAALQARAVELQRASSTDELTGTANRRELLLRLKQSLEQASANGSELAVMLFDIDHFKQVNDRHGHAVGDAVLVRCTRCLQAALPAESILGRFGGEEFMLILPDKSVEEALALAESLRRALAAGSGSGGGPAVTTSIGLALLSDHPGADVDRLIEAADRALYAAKHAGRNCVVRL